MHSVDDVLTEIRQKVIPVQPSPVALEEAGGYRLAEPVRMLEDSPPFDRALVDGCAVLCGESEGKLDAGVELKVVAHLDAGALIPPGLQVGAGEAVEINTGAPLPPGADAVVMVEHLKRAADGRVQLTKGVTRGFGLQRRGADAAAGSIVLEAVTRLSPAALAVCAAAGASRISVRAPRVALLTTGDELVPAGTPTLKPGQIRNSNHPMLSALLKQADVRLIDLGTARDDRETLETLLKNALAQADLLLVTGGMSMGTRDLVPPLLKDLGFTLHVEKVRMKPGKPFLFGTKMIGDRQVCVCGLPGNPVSAFVTYQRFVREVIGRQMGADAAMNAVKATTATALSPNGDREFFQPCRLERTASGWRAHPLTWKGSADLFTLSKADGLLILPAGAPAKPAGEPCHVLVL